MPSLRITRLDLTDIENPVDAVKGDGTVVDHGGLRHYWLVVEPSTLHWAWCSFVQRLGNHPPCVDESWLAPDLSSDVATCLQCLVSAL